MRLLKYHEQRLLKKVNFLHYKEEDELYERKTIKTFHLKERDDYSKYKKICIKIKKLVELLRQLEPNDEVRINLTEQLLNKLYHSGVLYEKRSLEQVEKIGVPALAKRRLAIIMVKTKMVKDKVEATKFIEQGHVRVGPNTITDPAYHVTRSAEDYVTWVDSSKIKKKVLTYNDQYDDYDILN